MLAVVGIAAFALWPRPDLVPYTTPPLDSKGTRIQLLIPRGWLPDASTNAPKLPEIRLIEIRELDWLPDWARRIMRARDRDERAFLDIQLDRQLRTDGPYEAIGLRDGKGINARRRQPCPGGGTVLIWYVQVHEQGFDKETREIFDSVKVL